MIARLVGRPIRGPSHRRVLGLVAALLVTLTSPALAQDRATYGARPAPGEGDRSSGSFFLSVESGSVTSDAVEIINLAGEPASFDVYVVDVEHGSRGDRTAAARDADPPAGPATWIAVDRAVVEVPPRGSELVAFTVEVPDGTPLGAQTAALMVEPHQLTDAGAIVSRTRVGLWVEIEVLEGSDAGPDPEVPGGPASPPWTQLVALTMAVVLGVGILLYITRRRWQHALGGWRGKRGAARSGDHHDG